MDILVLNPILFSGEKEYIPDVSTIKDTMIYNMCLAFVGLGHRVTLLAIDDYRPTEEEAYEFEIVFFRNNFKGIFPAALPCSLEMYSYVKKHSVRFDMIFASEAFGFHTLFAALAAPSKTVIWQELVGHQRKMKTIPSRIWHNVVVPLFFRKTILVIGRSEPAVKFISRYMKNISREYVDHGINISKFQLAKTKKRQFISVAQFTPRKRIDSIIDVFSQFVQVAEYADFRLLLAGRGPLEDNLRQQVKALGLETQVVFLGFLCHRDLNKNLSESYASLINTSNDLNMVSIPESIVSGTPIVCNRVPALSGFIKENRLGIAKDNWTEADLVAIVKNDKYWENCIAMREKLSSQSAARRIVDIFMQSKIDSGR